MKRFPALVLGGLLALLAAFPAAAQDGHWLAVKGGWGEPYEDVSTALPITGGPSASGGFVGGLAWEGGLKGRWNVEAEVLYAQRKASVTYFGGMSDQGNPQGDVTSEYTFTTLEIPFHFKYAFTTGPTRVFGLGGWNTSIPLEIESVNSRGGQSLKEKAKDQFDSIWLALELGAGVEHRFTPDLSLQGEIRYSFGVTDVAASGNDSWKWRDLRFLLGLKFNL